MLHFHNRGLINCKQTVEPTAGLRSLIKPSTLVTSNQAHVHTNKGLCINNKHSRLYHIKHQVQRKPAVLSAAKEGFSEASKPGNDDSRSTVSWAWVAGSVVLFIMAAVAADMGIKAMLVNSPLGKSGFLAAFSLIFLSEIGDKTFFIAALLAMKLGKWISFSGSLTSLAIMTIISVAIGAVFSKVPDALKSSVPVGELAGIALLVFFGIRALRDGLKKEHNALSSADEEMAEADEAVKAAEQGGKMRRSSPFKAFFEVATLIFIAEWGDRSMLATIALGAAQNPVGVATGAIVGHAIATGIAVVGGAIASKYVSEKTINITSGILFLLFAVATAYSMM